MARGKLTSKSATKVAAGPEVSLAILPFRNGSGDAGLDWLGTSLADMLSTDVGQSAHLRTISPDRLHQVLSDLQISPGTAIDPSTVGRIAEFSTADTVVWGQYAKFGDHIRIDATLRDLKHQRTIPVKAEAANEKALLPAIAQLAQTIQQNLALSPDVLQDLRAKSSRPSSSSLPALRSYNEGLELERQGNHIEAAKRFAASVQADPNFAMAYSRLGQTYSNLRNDDKAREFSQKAVDLSDKLPAPERYLIQANCAQVSNDFRKAIEFTKIWRKFHQMMWMYIFHLGGLYESTGAYDKARIELSKVLAIDPKHVDALVGRWPRGDQKQESKGLADYLNRGSFLQSSWTMPTVKPRS
jgi:TolB-like protein